MTGFNVEEFGSTLGSNINTEQLRITASEYYRNRPGFFAPFQSGTDFGKTLAAPIVVPLTGAILTGLLSAASAISVAVCIGSLAATAITAAAGKNDVRDTALTIAAVSGIIIFLAPLIAALTAIAAVLATLASVVELGTRSTATVVSLIGKAFQSCMPSSAVVEEEPQDYPAPLESDSAPLAAPSL